MNGDLSAFTLGTVDPFADAVPNLSEPSTAIEFPTRPEGPTPMYSDAFGFASPVVQASDLLPGEPTTTVDWSQLLVKAGSFAGQIAQVTGNITDAITGRTTSTARAAAAARTQQKTNMAPLLLIGGGLAVLFFMGRK